TFKKEYHRPPVAFAVAYFDVTPPAIHQVPLEDRFVGAREGTRAQLQGEVVSERATPLGAYPGREWHIAGGRGACVRRMYAIPDGENTRIFLLTVAGSGITPSSPLAGKFLQSFTFHLPDPVEAAEIPPEWWAPFASAEGRFRIAFPKRPAVQEKEI